MVRAAKFWAAFCITVVLSSLNISVQQKRFYIAPDDHADYFWIADDVTYRQSFLTMIDY